MTKKSMSREKKDCDPILDLGKNPISSSYVTKDYELMGGQLVFTNTRVPVCTLFSYLKDDLTISNFLDHYPTVSREAVIKTIDYFFCLLNEANVEVIKKETP